MVRPKGARSLSFESDQVLLKVLSERVDRRCGTLIRLYSACVSTTIEVVLIASCLLLALRTHAVPEIVLEPRSFESLAFVYCVQPSLLRYCVR